MDKQLHAEKVEILSRLIKESSLTLEEALLLLKEEEVTNTSLPFAPFNQPVMGRPFDVIYGSGGTNSGGVVLTHTGRDFDINNGTYTVPNSGAFSTTITDTATL